MGFYGNATYYLPNGTAKYIEKNAVTAEAINEKAVTTEKINDGAVSKEKIADQAITELKIYSNAVTKDKIAVSSIQGLGGDRPSLNVDGVSQRPSHIAEKTICGEKHNKGDNIFGDIALGTITGGANGNIASKTIDSSNIVLGSISDECLQEDYMFIEPYSVIDSSADFTEYLTSLAEKNTMICGRIELSQNIADNNGVILDAGKWMILKLSGTKATDTSWLIIKANAIEEFIVERKTDKTWSILQENSLLMHDYITYNIQSLSNWQSFLSSKFYKNKNYIKNINFDIQNNEIQNFQLYIDENTQSNDKKIMEGSYIGFWFDSNTFYLADKKGNLINYINNKFIIINMPQLNLISDGSIPLSKLDKACLNIEELGVITSIKSLSEKLKEIGKVVTPSTICSFTSQNIEQLENDNIYYATLLIQDSLHSYWQISSSLLGDFNNSFNIEAYSSSPELVENLIVKENSIQEKHIENGAIVPNKLDREYQEIYFLKKTEYTLRELAEEIHAQYKLSSEKPICFYSSAPTKIQHIHSYGTEGLYYKIECEGRRRLSSIHTVNQTQWSITSLQWVEEVKYVFTIQDDITSLAVTKPIKLNPLRLGRVVSEDNKISAADNLPDMISLDVFHISTIQESSIEDWNDDPDENSVAPVPGVYLIIGIVDTQTHYLIGVSVNKRYMVAYDNFYNQYTVEITG